jgi:Ca2+-binding RTX toxin-like protein
MSLSKFDLQALESRQLMSVSSALDSVGTLTITGTSGNDSVYVSYQIAGNLVIVNDGSATPKKFDYSKVKKIVAIGNAGDDSLWISDNMGAVKCSLDGGAGNDRLYAAAGNDTLVGGAGSDNLAGGMGKDSLDGGDGNDTLAGSYGNDTLKGGAGNDRLAGGNDNDSLDGGTGADDLWGDSGTDVVTYASRTNGVTVDITDQNGELADDGEAGEHDFVHTDIENLIGGSGNDKFTGTVATVTTTPGFTKNNTFRGGAGNDTLIGLDGNDSLDGGSGNDSIDGGAGNDSVNGGTGTDKMIGGTGTDTADYSGRSENLKLSLDGVANDGAIGENDLISADFENLTGGNGNDTITGNATANTLKGNAGNDTIKGGAGNDTLFGDTGIDQLFGEAGDDTLYARKSSTSTLADNDKLDGGLGTDKAQVDSTDTKTSIETLMA